VNGGNGPNTTAAATHQQLQSIMPPNATEILDRLMNDIGTSETGGGPSFVGGAGNGQAGNFVRLKITKLFLIKIGRFLSINFLKQIIIS
jgi:hypothetical protein